MKKLAGLCLVAVLALSVNGLAGEKAHQGGKQTALTGTLVCLGCDLAKADGARAACSSYGHKHALKTESGELVSFLENDFAKDLMAGDKYHNQKIEVSGVYHERANMIDVHTFTVGNQTKGWCDGCKQMDGCSISSKGHKGSM